MAAPIYSKIEYENANSAQKEILESEASLLKIIEYIESYRRERKIENVYKIKLKKLLQEVKIEIGKIMKEVPRTDGVKELEKLKTSVKEHKIKGEQKVRGINIRHELEEIQKRLEEIS